ncbi:MAG: ABC transporter ATP-binding protein, partial [Actinomycetota bacterium]
MSQPTAGEWRGIAAEDLDNITASLSALLRRRGRRLLQDLLRPHRGIVTTILVLIVTANLGALAGPWLVGIGVDRIPQVTRQHDLSPLLVVIVGFGAAV